MISLHDNLPEAMSFRDSLYHGRILRIVMPRDMRGAGLRGGVNSEGYPFIYDRILAEYIQILKLSQIVKGRKLKKIN